MFMKHSPSPSRWYGSSRNRLGLFCLAALSLVVGRAQAATDLTWDTGAGGGIQTAGGNWDLTTTNWTSDGGASRVAWVNANLDNAIFTTIASAYNVVLTTPIVANNISFSSNGAGKVTLQGSQLTFGGTINVATGNVVAISSQLSGAGSIVSAGTLTLSGTTNNFTGGVTLNTGSNLILSGGGLGSDVLGTGLLTLNGGTLSTNLFTSETSLVNNMLFGGDFTFNHTTGGFSGAVDLGGATRTISGVGTANATFSGAVTNGGIIVSGSAGLGLSNVANTFSGGVTIAAGSKLTYTGASYSGSAGAVTAGSLGTGTLVFENGSTFLSSGAGSKVGNNMLANGNLSLNTNNLRFEGAFDLGGATRTITMLSTNGVTFAGKISNGGIVIAGTSGAVSLTNTENDFAGGVTVGPNTTLSITGNSVGTPGAVTKGPLGTGVLTINGGRITTNFTSNIYNDTTVGGNFTIVPDASSYFYGAWDLGADVRTVDVRSEFTNRSLQLGNVIKGSGGLTFTTSTNASYVSSIVMSGTASNTYTGVTTMSGAASTASLTLNKSGGATAIAGDLTITSGTVKYLSNNNQIADTSKVTVNGASAILDLAANRSDTVGTVVLDGGGSITGTGTSALTSTGSFDVRNGSVTAILAGSGIALTKTTAGTVTLSGANTYTGATTITEGTLVLGTTGSIASSTIGFGVTDSTSGLLTAQNTLFAFSGTLTLDLTSVTLAQASWTLFNGSAFGIGDLNLGNVTSNLGALTFVNDGSGNWSGTDANSRTWTFSEDMGTLSVVPEPATWALLGAGVLVLVIARRRRLA